MNTYLIHESNLERLEKKLATINKKCAKSNCSFHYEVKGATYREVEDNEGNKYTAKYFVVEVDGEAKYEGWRFVATLDHHSEGNVVRAFYTELTIPDKYKTCGPTCEHCNRIRTRKDTYLIYNDETSEFKQVGKNCLKEFTNGLSAEDVAFLVSVYEAAEGGYGYSGMSYNRYIEVEGILKYAFECYQKWGYQKAQQDGEYYRADYRSTRSRVTDYYYINREGTKRREILQAEMDEVGFNPDSEYATTNTKEALEWIRTMPEEEYSDNEYLRNLHVVCSDEFTDWRSLGILVSLTTAYANKLRKDRARKIAEAGRKKETEASSYVGEVNQVLDFEVTSFKCLSSWNNQYGTTYLYKFTDTSNNVFVWYASKCVEDPERVISIRGRVKDHSEYNGTKQTVLTRCKVEFSTDESEEESHPVGTSDVEDAINEFLAFVNA